ncbi:SPFH domain-containing protein [Streptomyces californicus]|uniref:SPFH domain-containing protein n=1 Tax=Streptomyces californicus TaxID=67351 RepID=UPI0037A93D3F
MTPNDDQSPRTSPTPHPLDDRLPPSLFAPPGRGSPPPLFGGAHREDPRPEGDRAPEGGGVVSRDGDSVPPGAAGPKPPGVSPHLGPVPDREAPDPGRRTDRTAPGPAAEGPSAGRPTRGPAVEGPSGGRTAPARPVPLDGNLYFKPVRRARTEPSGEWTPHPSYGAEPGGAKPDAGTVRGVKPEVRREDTGTAKGLKPGAGTPETGPAEGSGAAEGATPAKDSEAVADGGPEAGRASRSAPARGPVDDPGPDTELDLVLDLAPGGRAASATFSVPSPSAEPAASPVTTAADPVTTAATAAPAPGSPAHASKAAAPSVTAFTTATAATAPYPARRHSVIGNETTASIPVHLLFRDDREPAEATALPAGVLRRPVEERAPAARRPPVPRSPQTRVRPSTRPAPDADPGLTERPGPALPGSAALLAGAAAIAGGLAVLWWRGVLPAAWQTAVGLTPRPDLGIGAGAWALLAALATVTLLALGGLGRGRVGYAWVLTLFGDYRGSVRRTGLVWVSPLLLRRRVDVRLRHWRSEPLPAVDATGTALRVVVLVVWRIKDTVRAALGIEDHEAYLSAQVEAALARVLSQLPADAFHEDAPSLRDAEAVGDALTRLLKADCEPVGVEVYSAQPTGIEYAPEVAAAMQRRRIAAIDSKHRDSVLTSVVDAVDDTVNRLTTRGIVELDDYERKALVKDLTVAFYTGRSGAGDGG